MLCVGPGDSVTAVRPPGRNLCKRAGPTPVTPLPLGVGPALRSLLPNPGCWRVPPSPARLVSRAVLHCTRLKARRLARRLVVAFPRAHFPVSRLERLESSPTAAAITTRAPRTKAERFRTASSRPPTEWGDTLRSLRAPGTAFGHPARASFRVARCFLGTRLVSFVSACLVLVLTTMRSRRTDWPTALGSAGRSV